MSGKRYLKFHECESSAGHFAVTVSDEMPKWVCVCGVCQAMNSINALLEKADRLYKQLLLSATPLDGLLSKISEHSIDKTHVSYTRRWGGRDGSPVTSVPMIDYSRSSVGFSKWPSAWLWFWSIDYWLKFCFSFFYFIHEHLVFRIQNVSPSMWNFQNCVLRTDYAIDHRLVWPNRWLFVKIEPIPNTTGYCMVRRLSL